MFKQNSYFFISCHFEALRQRLHHVRLACQSLSRVRIAPHSGNLGEVSKKPLADAKIWAIKSFQEICLQTPKDPWNISKHLETASIYRFQVDVQHCQTQRQRSNRDPTETPRHLALSVSAAGAGAGGATPRRQRQFNHRPKRFHKWSYSKMDGFRMDNSTKIRMIWRYPHFRKPPNQYLKKLYHCHANLFKLSHIIYPSSKVSSKSDTNQWLIAHLELQLQIPHKRQHLRHS